MNIMKQILKENINILKAKIIYKQIRSLKKESQKKYINWIYDPCFEIKIVKIFRKYFRNN